MDMKKLDKWESEHVNWSGAIHVFLGLGIAWLLSLIWHCSLISLVLGIIFLVAGLVGLLYIYLASRKIEI